MNLYYLGEIDFQKKQAAGANRVINNCKAIKENNKINVQIIGYGNISKLETDNFNIFNIKKGKNQLFKFMNYLFRGLQFIKLLQKLTESPNIVVYYGTSTRILLPLLLYCKIKNIKLVVDVVEWYDYSHLPLGKYGPIALDVHFAMTKLILKCDGIIAISTFLYNYYSNKGIKSIRIPMLIERNANKLFAPSNINKFDFDHINLIYAGTAGKKDLIANIIKAVEFINKKGIKVNFHIIGMSFKDLSKIYGGKTSSNIKMYGKLPHNTVLAYLKQADYSILLRHKKRYAQAGFPSKFVESMNNGLPVIANITSDLSLYLKDGYNGFILEDSSTEAIIEIIKKVNQIDKEKLMQFKHNAINTAKDFFDYHLYSNDLNAFLHSV